MRYPCCDPRRLEVLQHLGSDNAIEFLEVLDHAAPPAAPRQRTLLVRLLRSGFVLQPQNLSISGGARIRTVGVEWCAAADSLPAQAEAGLVESVPAVDLPRTLVVRTDSAGDFSSYAFAIVANLDTAAPPLGFDPRLSSISFSFKVDCPTPFDCAEVAPCPADASVRPDIDYLAKDYQSFRRLMLDRLSLLVPGWAERSSADVGMTLVELLAYAADNLSYRQDVIANEAYLGTARKRVSVRRHARLVDYVLHEGCNARAFVHLVVTEGQSLSLPRGTRLVTRTPGLPSAVVEFGLEAQEQIVRNAVARGAQVFETAQEALLDSRLNELLFYAWGDNGCCLPRGSTRATLRERLDDVLHVGDLLLFEEVENPNQAESPSFDVVDGSANENADRAHRWVVRLTRVTAAQDPSGHLFDPEPSSAPLDVTEIEWDAADALPFPLCLSIQERPSLAVSVARGNVVLADHGRSVSGEALGRVPEVSLYRAGAAPGGSCGKAPKTAVPPRFRPALVEQPLTHGFDLEKLLSVASGEVKAWPARSLSSIDPWTATPLVTTLTSELRGIQEQWSPRRDLLDSGASAPHFAVEVEDDGRARLRFGDDTHGKRPAPGTSFLASYRVGNGAAGNVGAESIAHVISALGGVTRVRNPLPAAGGVEPEDIEAARRDAPQAFRKQERAVTPADYALAAERLPEVQRAAATFRWTGSWYTAFVTADRFGGAAVDAPFVERMRGHLEPFRMAGYDLEVQEPRHVPLDVALHVCVRPRYIRTDVLRAVQRVLSRDVLGDGRRGVFHPDNFSFGDAVYLSRIIAAVQTVEGVDSVRALRFQRLVDPSPTSLDEAVIPIGSLEIAELANDPNFPELGRLALSVGGGK